MPDFDNGVWIGLAAPSHVPQEVLARLTYEMQKAMAAKDLRERLVAAGFDPPAAAPENLAGFLRTEQERYAEVIRKANITLEGNP